MVNSNLVATDFVKWIIASKNYNPSVIVQKLYEMVADRPTSGKTYWRDINLNIEAVETPDGFLEICFNESQKKEVGIFLIIK
jgi:hypothetical protein